MKITIDSREFESKHLQKPKGWAAWEFEGERIAYDPTPHAVTNTFQANGWWSKVKKEAFQWAKANGFETLKVKPWF